MYRDALIRKNVVMTIPLDPFRTARWFWISWSRWPLCPAMFHSERPIPVHKTVPLHRTRWGWVLSS